VMRKTYRVREFAVLAGVTAKALHHYDRVGLLTPHRTDAGYRAYTNDDLLRLQQIVALKLVGLSLRQIRQVFEGGVLPLRDALRAQHAALQERRGQIDRALAALERAQRATDGNDGSDAAVLTELIEVLARPSVHVLRKYFSDDAWVRWRLRHESWPSPEWVGLYREAQSALAEDPAAPRAQDLARRCIALFETDTQGDAAIRTALRKASLHHAEWVACMQAAMPDVDVERVGGFLASAAWATWDAPDGRTSDTPRVRPKASPAWTTLLHDFETALGEDPLSERVQQLMARRAALIDDDSGGDPAMRVQIERAGARWHKWPDGMRRWIASTYGMRVETWERVTALIEAARQTA
jgi:MerR family transcriptional regulator, thiopeptide resistance regulator